MDGLKIDFFNTNVDVLTDLLADATAPAGSLNGGGGTSAAATTEDTGSGVATELPAPVDDFIAERAKSALKEVEKLSAQIAASTKVKTCREAWIKYGKALLEQRAKMPSTQKFGRWIKDNHLDAGIASNRVVRSDAMWMAEHADELSELKGLRNHYPSNLRQELRDAGYQWASKQSDEEEDEEETEDTIEDELDKPVVETPRHSGQTGQAVNKNNKPGESKTDQLREAQQAQTNTPRDKALGTWNAIRPLLDKLEAGTILVPLNQLPEFIDESDIALLDRHKSKLAECFGCSNVG